MFKEEIIHLMLSIFAGLIVGYIVGDYRAIFAAIISGFLIDIDHFFDYFKYKGLKKFDIKEFFSGKYFDITKKIYLPLHGYEFGIILMILGIYYRLEWLLVSMGLSLILHLVYDTISNKPKWPTYSIIYRAINNFDHDKFEFKKGE